ncbi:PIN domain-containing protein [Oxalobacteraceae bacterium A2-2]
MAIVLFDTNILIDHLRGIQAATNELGSYEDAVISTISWMEACCKMNEIERAELNAALADIGIAVLQTDVDIMEMSADLRGRTKKKLPDCIIRATALGLSRTIITRDPNDFGGLGAANVHVPYELVGGVVVNIKPVACASQR